MKAKSFLNGIFQAIVLLSVAFVVCSLAFSALSAQAEEVPLHQKFYFLVAEEQCNQSCLSRAYYAGGGGVELYTENGSFAVYACYTGANAEEAAIEAKGNLRALHGENANVVQRTRNALFLHTREEKRRKNEILSTLNLLNDCAAILNFAAKSAESGENGQEELKGLAKNVALVLLSIAKTQSKGSNGEAEVECAKSCGDIAAKLKEASKGIVYARDLRQAQIRACLVYLDYSAEYAA